MLRVLHERLLQIHPSSEELADWQRHVCVYFKRNHMGVQTWLVAAVSLVSTLAMASFYFSSLVHMSHATVASPRGDFLDTQISNTLDISAPALVRPLLLYLDRQVLHHLFPSVDHSKLSRLKPVLSGLRARSGTVLELNRAVNGLLNQQ
jgi:fatty acid desaturase